MSICIDKFYQNNMTIQVCLIVPSHVSVCHYKAEKTQLQNGTKKKCNLLEVDGKHHS